MDDEIVGQLGELLFEHHMIYQQKLKREVTQKEFSEYIGLDDKLYNHIYRGRRKAGKKVIKFLAEFFDDLRFYDVIGEPRPDPRLFYVQRNWENIPSTIQKQVTDVIANYIMKEKKE